MKTITVFGAGGFIGSSVCDVLRKDNYTVNVGDWRTTDFNQKNLGQVIVCCGVGDCSKVDEVIYSHVDVLRNIIKTSTYERLVYISSTRIYLDSDSGREDSQFSINQCDVRVLFNQVKLLAETIIKSQPKPYAILRPSNVYGKAFNSPLFLPSLVRDAIQNKKINLYVSPEYAKDYVFVDDVSGAVLSILKYNIPGVFNIASGENVSAGDIVDIIQSKTQCEVVWHPNNNHDNFPLINIEKLSRELMLTPRKVKNMLYEMIDDFKNKFSC